MIGLALVTNLTDDFLQDKRKLMGYTELPKATNERHIFSPFCLFTVLWKK